MQPYEAEIRQFIVDNFLFGEGGSDLGEEDCVGCVWVFGSTGVMELVGFLQSKFQIQVEDNEIVPANLDSIAKIRTFVQQKKG